MAQNTTGHLGRESLAFTPSSLAVVSFCYRDHQPECGSSSPTLPTESHWSRVDCWPRSRRGGPRTSGPVSSAGHRGLAPPSADGRECGCQAECPSPTAAPASLIGTALIRASHWR